MIQVLLLRCKWIVGRISSRTAEAYSPLQKSLHWSVVIPCLVQVPTAWAIQRTHVAHSAGLPPDPVDLLLHRIHAWSGWLILAMVSLRILLRVFQSVPPLPADVPRWSGILSTLCHASLYATLLALPATGTLAMYVNGSFAPIHVLLTKLLLLLILAHTAAALWHLLIRRDRVTQAMLPRIAFRCDTAQRSSGVSPGSKSEFQAESR